MKNFRFLFALFFASALAVVAVLLWSYDRQLKSDAFDSRRDLAVQFGGEVREQLIDLLKRESPDPPGLLGYFRIAPNSKPDVRAVNDDPVLRGELAELLRDLPKAAVTAEDVGDFDSGAVSKKAVASWVRPSFVDPLQGQSGTVENPWDLFRSKLKPVGRGKERRAHFLLDRPPAVGDTAPMKALLRDDSFMIFFRHDPARAVYAGFIVNFRVLIQQTTVKSFGRSLLSEASDLWIVQGGNRIYRTDEGDPPSKDLPFLVHLFQLPAPLSEFFVAVTIPALPVTEGMKAVRILTLVFFILFVLGGYATYRSAVGGIELSQKKEDFVSAVSHELKSPITSIKMFGEILLTQWFDDDAKRKTYLERICEESDRLTRLIENVLQLARLEKNTWALRLEGNDPAALAAAVAEKLRPAAAKAGFQIDVSCDRDRAAAPNILVDSDAFAQILTNLIDNAIKFSKDAEEKRVSVRIDGGNDGCWLRVRDFGPGVPAGQMRKIFMKFHRADNELTRKAPGAGIGLALVEMLVKRMKGEVRVENRSPGAEFSVWIPAG